MIKEDHTPLVTVAMVTYNSEKYVSMAIESVLASSYKNLELIISDDCSADKTWDIVSDYTNKDSRIKVYRNDFNIGEYPNREICISKAKGKYLIFIDGDDMIYPRGLEFAINEIEKFPSAAIALAMQWRDYVFYPYILEPRENMYFTYFGDGFLNNSFAQSLFNTKILKSALPFPEKIKCGDTYIKMKISLNNNVLLINGPISWWRQTPGQASYNLKANNQEIFEQWKIDKLILSEENIPLNSFEIQSIWSNRNYHLRRQIIKQLIKFNFKTAVELIKLTTIKKLYLASKQPFFKANACPSNPLTSFKIC